MVGFRVGNGISWTICKLETDRNSVSVTAFRPKPPKNMVSAWFRLRQIGTAELRFRPKLDHVETETSRNWISSVSCSDLQSDDVIFQKRWAGLTAWSESSKDENAEKQLFLAYNIRLFDFHY